MLPDWRGRAIACLASGPSLTAEDCERVRAAGLPTVVTNTTFRLCLWADVLYAFDKKWWNVYLEEARRDFRGRLFTQLAFPPPGVETVAGDLRFFNGWNSGAAAISFSILCGATRIVLLGYDCQLTGGRSHHHGDHPAALRNCDSLAHWATHFSRVAKYAAGRGAAIVNASRETALTCFPRAPLEVAIDESSP